MAFLLTRCWGAGWTDGETGEFIPANNWKLLLSANTVIWITAFTGWNISTGFRFSNSFLKLLSLPHCLPVSLLLPPPSLILFSSSLCSQSASSWWAYWQLHRSALLSYWDLFAAFPALYWSCACSTSMCVCVRVCVCLSGVAGLIVIEWLHCALFIYFYFIDHFCPTSQGEGSHRGCSRLHPGTLCFRPGRQWSSQTLNCWTSAPKCSCMACSGRGRSVGHQPSGRAGESEVWLSCCCCFVLILQLNVINSLDASAFSLVCRLPLGSDKTIMFRKWLEFSLMYQSLN